MRAHLEILAPIALPDGIRPLATGESVVFTIGSREPIVVSRHIPASLQPLLVEAAERGLAALVAEQVSPARIRAALQGIRVLP